MTFHLGQAGPRLYSGRTFVGRKKCPDPALPGRMTTHKHRKGTTVKPTGHTANTASTSKTGLFATFCGLLPAKGSGAPKITQGIGAPKSAVAARRYLLTTLVSLCAATAALLCSTAPALAMVDAPGWEVSGYTGPTVMAPGSTGNVWLVVNNTGAAENTGGVVTDTLPAGLRATGGLGCTGETVVMCSVSAMGPGGGAYHLGIPVSVSPGASGEAVNRVSVEGGGAANIASTSFPVRYGTTLAGAGFSSFNAFFSNADGSVDTQAGSHPYEFTLDYSVNTITNSRGNETPAGEPRNFDFRLPPGFVGNPNAVPECPRAQFDEGEEGESDHKGCPPSTRIGLDVAELSESGQYPRPVYNLVPPAGLAAQFGFAIKGIVVLLDAKVRSGGDYGITEHVFDVPKIDVLFNTTTIWGNPSDASLDPARASSNPECVPDSVRGGCVYTGTQAPFLTLPTSCGKQQPIFAEMIGTWQESEARAHAEVEPHNSEGAEVGITGCERLVHYNPTAAIAPDTTSADGPSGLTAEVTVPQNVNPETLSTAGLKDTTVTLPEGIAINPGQATGLAACQPAQENIGGPEAEDESEDGPPSCPLASKVGTDEISTPLLRDKLVGNVYVLQSNPPNLQLLVAASGDGVNLKLIGNVHLNEATGRLTTTFENTPDFPFTVFKLAFSGGAQAALVTPTRCNTYTSEAVFTPWSTPFVENALSLSRFEISSGPDGSSCTQPGVALPFSPSLTAGATTDQAGGFTDFSLLLQRGDGQQRFSSLSFEAPAGLAGMLASVPLCGEEQANAGTCSSASQIGHAVVGAGPGPYPFYIPQNGAPAAAVYLTGSYHGAPFGLSIVTPVVAGPFNLGTNVVRAKIEVDPHTAQITVTTDPSGPHSIPTILDGIPTDIRSINTVIDRPGFMFNPTNCNPQEFSGTAYSGEGASAAISTHFQMGSCRSLEFKPDFKVSTSAKTTKKYGASLDAKILYPTGPFGGNQASSQSNIASVKVDLPKQLPSRLTTLQKACTAAVFEANPANCPATSVVGRASAVTPVLPVPLVGPAYFVSHGGEAFPSLEVILQGDGVTIDLVGTTFISKAGITSSTFKSVPDVPISSFDLNLPTGPYSALAANLPVSAKGSFCRQKLVMPTAFTGQNGAVIHQSTPLTVTGCPKVEKATKPKKKAHKSSRNGKGRK
jgi:hypothetical protein